MASNHLEPTFHYKRICNDKHTEHIERTLMNTSRKIYIVHIKGNLANAYTNRKEAEESLERVKKICSVDGFEITEITLYTPSRFINEAEWTEAYSRSANESGLCKVLQGNDADTGIVKQSDSNLSELRVIDSDRVVAKHIPGCTCIIVNGEYRSTVVEGCAIHPQRS